jgi:hypothetical protein
VLNETKETGKMGKANILFPAIRNFVCSRIDGCSALNNL